MTGNSCIKNHKSPTHTRLFLLSFSLPVSGFEFRSSFQWNSSLGLAILSINVSLAYLFPTSNLLKLSLNLSPQSCSYVKRYFAKIKSGDLFRVCINTFKIVQPIYRKTKSPFKKKLWLCYKKVATFYIFNIAKSKTKIQSCSDKLENLAI